MVPSPQATKIATMDSLSQGRFPRQRKDRRLGRGYHPRYHDIDPGPIPLDSSLPDDLILRIGTFVAKICDLRDYVHFSMASKRHKKLLVDSKETVNEVIRLRTSRIKNRWSSAPVLPRNLEQVRFYEVVARHTTLLENCCVGGNPLRVVGCHRDRFCRALRNVLDRCPTAQVVLDAHDGRRNFFSMSSLGDVANTLVEGMGPWSQEWINRKRAAAGGRFDLSRYLVHSLVMRTWGARVPHVRIPTRDLWEEGWVEVRLRLLGEDSAGDEFFELPPRPDFYRGIEVPREYRWRDPAIDFIVGESENWEFG